MGMSDVPRIDRAGLESLFGYTDFAWREITGVISRAGGDALTRPAPGSGWPALRDCLAHMLLAYHRWVDGLGELKSCELPGYGYDQFRTLTEVQAYRERVRANFRAQLDGDDGYLFTVQEFDIDGEPMAYSRAELLAHLLLHERAHHGDVTTLFYQLGIEPYMLLEYRFYVTEQRQRP
jgi:uncharacterized damage-inducible protein DinB